MASVDGSGLGRDPHAMQRSSITNAMISIGDFKEVPQAGDLSQDILW